MPKENRVMVIGDLHAPFDLDSYLEHCVLVRDTYEPTKIILTGDVIDNHYSSYHETDPDGFGAGEELERALHRIGLWYKEFPKADVCIGNHDDIIKRKAKTAGISNTWIKDAKDILKTPKWNFGSHFIYDNVNYRHGTGMVIRSRITSDLMSTVQGHYHTSSEIIWKVGKNFRVFGMQVGCGVDKDSYAMAYAKDFPKPAISCGLVLENGQLPIIEMAKL